MTYEVAFPVKNELGEGPVWDEKTGCLIWCDILGQTLFIGDAQNGLMQTFGFGEPVSAAFLSEETICMWPGQAGCILNRQTRARALVIEIEQDNPLTRANDSRVAPAGDLVRNHGPQAGRRGRRGLSYQRQEM